tara:strand:+ start:401 stop:694 length:294 start_codon:yes stop_codon:yes gene_type:complete
MANNIYIQWQNLEPEEQNFYLEFHGRIINNIRQIPDNEELIYYGACVPTEGHINYVLETDVNFSPTLNFRLTDGQRNSIIDWIMVNLPEHLESINTI